MGSFESRIKTVEPAIATSMQLPLRLRELLCHTSWGDAGSTKAASSRIVGVVPMGSRSAAALDIECMRWLASAPVAETPMRAATYELHCVIKRDGQVHPYVRGSHSYWIPSYDDANTAAIRTQRAVRCTLCVVDVTRDGRRL